MPTELPAKDTWASAADGRLLYMLMHNGREFGGPGASSDPGTLGFYRHVAGLFLSRRALLGATDTTPGPSQPGNHNALTITTLPKPVTGLCSCGALTEVEHEGQADTWWAAHRAAEGVTGWDDGPVELRTHCGCGRALPCRHCPEEP